MVSLNPQKVCFHENDIDNVVIIDEVERRPIIFNKTLKEYTNIPLKTKAWEEVTSKVFFRVWDNLSVHQKREAGKLVQKRWKNIRACFSRELRAQKSTNFGQAAKDRRAYKHFEKLLFLVPRMQTRETFENVSALVPEDDISAGDDTGEDKPRRVQQVKKKMKKNSSYKNRLVDILERTSAHEANVLMAIDKNKSADIDPETHFLLSLVPKLKQIPDEKKIDVQIQLLQVFNNFEHQNQLHIQSAFTQPSTSGIQLSRPKSEHPRLTSQIISPRPHTLILTNLASTEDSLSAQSLISSYSVESDASEEVYDINTNSKN